MRQGKLVFRPVDRVSPKNLKKLTEDFHEKISPLALSKTAFATGLTPKKVKSWYKWFRVSGEGKC
jgi:hypothetical protein